jgi:hypothetical protein
MKLARALVSGGAWNHTGKLAEYGLLYLTSVPIARSSGVQIKGECAALPSNSNPGELLPRKKFAAGEQTALLLSISSLMNILYWH